MDPSGTLDSGVSIVVGLGNHLAHLVGEVVIPQAAEGPSFHRGRNDSNLIGPTLSAHQGSSPLCIGRDQKGQDDPIPDLLVSCEVPIGQNRLQRREVGVGEVCPGEVCPAEVGVGEVCPGEVGLIKVGLDEICPVEVYPAEVSPGEVGLGEVGPGEVGPAEVGPGEDGLGEVGPSEDGPTEVGPFPTLLASQPKPVKTNDFCDFLGFHFLNLHVENESARVGLTV